MICPNCKVEYREGFTECSDCHVNLITDTRTHVSRLGLSTIKFGALLLFLTFFELFTSVICYEFIFTYRLNHGGVATGSTPITIIHPLVWIGLCVEFLISFVFISHGIYVGKKSK